MKCRKIQDQLVSRQPKNGLNYVRFTLRYKDILALVLIQFKLESKIEILIRFAYERSVG